MDQHADMMGRVTRLRALRLAQGLSQAEVAKQAGVSVTTVSACERGLSSPLLLERIASVFGVQPQRLLDRVPLTASE